MLSLVSLKTKIRDDTAPRTVALEEKASPDLWYFDLRHVTSAARANNLEGGARL